MKSSKGSKVKSSNGSKVKSNNGLYILLYMSLLIVLVIGLSYLIYYLLDKYDGGSRSPVNAVPEHSPSDIDCVGSWSKCDSNCSKVYTVEKAKSGTGKPCPYADGETATCNDGDGECVSVDCEGQWSTCTADCSDKTYTVSVAQSGTGESCPYADGETARCNPGEGDCPQSCITRNRKLAVGYDHTNEDWGNIPKQCIYVNDDRSERCAENCSGCYQVDPKTSVAYPCKNVSPGTGGQRVCEADTDNPCEPPPKGPQKICEYVGGGSVGPFGLGGSVGTLVCH